MAPRTIQLGQALGFFQLPHTATMQCKKMEMLKLRDTEEREQIKKQLEEQ
jgi:hypothetical protein